MSSQIKVALPRLSLAIILGISILGCTSTGEGTETQGGDSSVPDTQFGQCSPGEERCQDGFLVVCSGNGLWIDTNEVGGCGGSQNSCAINAQQRSYIGCDYWAVDLDNAIEVYPLLPDNGTCRIPGNDDWMYVPAIMACQNGNRLAGLCTHAGECPDGQVCVQTSACVLDAQNSNFSIVVANPSTTMSTQVNLETPNGQQLTEMVAPGATTVMTPAAVGAPDASIDGSGVFRSAYRLTSTSPIVAYQFNPLDNEGVFSNDGSLLLPSHAVGSVYFVMSLPTIERRPYGHPYSGYVTVVAVDAGQSVVEVIPSTNIRAGRAQMAYEARQPITFNLQQGDVLNLEASGRGDLTGTRIASVGNNQKLAVFVGHESVLLTNREPNDGQERACCGDHVEEQLFPVSTWGDRFAVARSAERTDGLQNGRVVPDRVRILASKSDTRIEFSPAPSMGQCGALVAGDYCDVYIDRDTEIIANNPILVGQMLLSTDGELGDPALAFVPPIEQWREDYTFLVPSEYTSQYVSIVSLNSGTIILNGNDVSAQLSDFGDGLRGGRIAIERVGQQTLACSSGCGLMVMGYDEAVSYMFAGGLDLEPIQLD